ncbi:transcription factor HES-5-like [Thalassophryne amazonica]|uniref:transcription factor HES-5-like n=1 Tax=Thalassophryne amazonica TaxID=390379 RepID=UPI001471E699|nr:transcription factor HES-5-like [Thalassophryne amazonica]
MEKRDRHRSALSQKLHCTRMAPSTTRDSPIAMLSSKDRHKLRKPVVEKMRRDRINSCIEQLKVLLEKEFHKQDPNAKLEKADVLEMTVVFLKQQLQPQGSDHGEGYSRCWKETLHFLTANTLKEAMLPHLRYVHSAHRADHDTSSTCAVSSQIQVQVPAKHLSSPTKAVWRPW